jgi:hypothetical protein
MKRLTDWRSKLSATIEAHRRLPFAYGRNDCALFVASCVEAMTGVDLAVLYRGRYTSANEAMQVLRAAGHDDVCALIALQFEEIHPALARAGDVMAFPAERTGWALGIVNGERVTVLREDGLGTLSREQATRAFRCP